MIAEVERVKRCEGLVYYNENKVDMGEATKIECNMLSNEKQDIILDLNNTAALNKNVQNKFVHINMNLVPGEQLTDQKFVELANEYLTKMGFENVPFVIYRHHDQEHQHVHIVASCVDYDGHKVNDQYERVRSQTASRELEIDFGLKQVSNYKTHEKSKLNEINASKFSTHKALKRHGKDPEHKAYLEKYLNITANKSNDLSNKELIELFGRKQFDELRNYLENNNIVYMTEKQKLFKTLDVIKNNSKDLQSFEKLCADNEIYIRRIGNQMGEPSYTYGIKNSEDKYTYFEQKQYQNSFSYKQLKNHFEMAQGKEIPKAFTAEQEMKYIETQVNKAIKASNSIDTFKDYLKTKNVNVILHSDNRGVYGISFSSTSGNNYSGSKINSSFTYGKIQKSLDKELVIGQQGIAVDKGTQLKKDVMETGKEQPKTTKSPKLATAQSEQSEQEQRKRKLEQQEEQNKRDLGIDDF